MPAEARRPIAKPHQKIAFDVVDYGIVKRRVQLGDDEEHDMFKIGHPVMFPNMLQVGSPNRQTIQFRVPMDGREHAAHIDLHVPRG